MNTITRERLFGYQHAFDHPVTIGMVLGLTLVVLLAPCVFLLLSRLGYIGAEQRRELFQRYWSWLVIIPLLLGPILLGAAWTIAGVAVLSLLCYQEYARATGLFREKAISLAVVLGILAVTFATFDHWYDLFVALFPLCAGSIALVAILADRPQGYIQRVALGVLGFALFGCALGHLGYMANEANYRPILLLILVAIGCNDVFAYIVGKCLGRIPLAPHTSPRKTVGGALGALVLTSLLVTVIGHFVFAGSLLDNLFFLLTLGALISILGQFGDLMLSSIKRDLGIKDMGTTLPGHGGLLDRFDSLILVAPVAFHYVGYFIGFGLTEPARILSRG
ncbi:MAG: phosphatidate cytidylyltransferase [Gemmataceae bacterium]